MFRLHIDIPIGPIQDRSIEDANNIIPLVKEALQELGYQGEIGIRLLNDGDRGNQNYLNIEEDSGRVLTRKTKIDI